MSTATETRAVDDPARAGAPSDPGGVPYLFTTDDFYRIIEAEVFPDEARVELWDGRIYEKMAKTLPHAAAGMTVNETLTRALPPGWTLSHENPVALGPDKAPLPDVVILRGRGHDYFQRRVEVADVGLVVEVAVTSLRSDLGSRLAAYAEAGIPTYWVVNLVDCVIHVHTGPIPAERRYETVSVVKPGESIALALDGVVVAQILASDILPAR